ncbi:hypothetical protein [Streptomyces sp. NPDC093225]|uniref:hypothetical protein n=1 Tax=Streptomyces sp. NPDC093225 TaxID=3366034 RepID=UPI00380057F5
MTNEKSGNGEEGDIGSLMSSLGRSALRHWGDTLPLLDPRYDDKRLKKAAARAMVDEEFRTHLVKNSDSFDGDGSGSSDRVRIEFHANGPSVLHVVLPPTERELENLPATLRDDLSSGSSERGHWFKDDWNWGDPGNDPGYDPTG